MVATSGNSDERRGRKHRAKQPDKKKLTELEYYTLCYAIVLDENSNLKEEICKRDRRVIEIEAEKLKLNDLLAQVKLSSIKREKEISKEVLSEVEEQLSERIGDSIGNYLIDTETYELTLEV